MKAFALAAAFTLGGTVLSSLALAPTASAEVRFGNNVPIGGLDVSNQRFTRHRRGRYVIHHGKPRRPGCRWRKNRDGSRIRVFRLQRKHER